LQRKVRLIVSEPQAEPEVKEGEEGEEEGEAEGEGEGESEDTPMMVDEDREVSAVIIITCYF
jgi:hypothetical protein